MKYILTVLLAGTQLFTHAQQHSLQKIWETDSIVAVPESVLAQAGTNILYISLIEGAPWEADGKGGVATLDATGKTYDSTWISGLNAPKGMGVSGNRLFVADINTVAVIDIKSRKIERKIVIDSAQGLNDIAVSEKGTVYVSDSRTGKVWRIENDQPSLYLSNLEGINGLRCVKDELFIGAGKSFVKANAQKQITTVAELPESIDGIEPVGNGDFILTAWAGYIFYVTATGNVQTILDTHLEKRNTADIGYDAVNRIVFVPTFFAKTIAAYKLL